MKLGTESLLKFPEIKEGNSLQKIRKNRKKSRSSQEGADHRKLEILINDYTLISWDNESEKDYNCSSFSFIILRIESFALQIFS